MRGYRFLPALAVLAFAPSAVEAEDQPVEIQIVDAMNKLWGTHPGFRANHAKGVVVEGSFSASPEAAALSKAALFDGKAIPVTVRFSNSTGMPNVADGSEAAIPSGMSLKFHLPDGSDTDMVLNALKFFPVATRHRIPRSAARAGCKPRGCCQTDEVRRVRDQPPRRCRPPWPVRPHQPASPSKSFSASMRSCLSTRPARGRRCVIR